MILPFSCQWENSCTTNFCDILFRRLWRYRCTFQSNYSRLWKAFRNGCQGTAPSERKNTVLETVQIWWKVDKGRQIFRGLFIHFTAVTSSAILRNYIFCLKTLSCLVLVFLLGEKKEKKTKTLIIHLMLWQQPVLPILMTSVFILCARCYFNHLSSDTVLALVVLCMSHSPISSSPAHPFHISHRQDS